MIKDENRHSFGAENKISIETNAAVSASTTKESTMFDRPHIVQPNQKQPDSSQQRLRLIFENDAKNSEIITNPGLLIKQLRCDNFIQLDKAHQTDLLEVLNQTLQKTTNNSAILMESAQVAQHGFRQNLIVIKQLESGILPDVSQQVGCGQDLLFQLILIGLTQENSQVAKVINQLCQGTANFEKCHLQLIYQFIRVKNQLQTTQRGLDILTSLFEHQSALRAQVKSYFYFNGFLSGILLNSKVVQPWNFTKGFAACIWFNISSMMADGKMQDSNNLPVLFNCFSAGFGGFECYFNRAKLFYRILPPSPYQPPTVDSNGILIQEFQTDRWNFLAVEHDKPFLARAQLIAIVNDKQVVNFSMDYPKFEKNAKLTLVSTCNNFIGQMSSFVVFKEPLNNLHKFIQIYKSHSADFQNFDSQVVDSKLQDKLLLTYIPWRTNGKIVYDCIDMNDGELLINCGVWGAAQNQRSSGLIEQGGIQSLIPLLSFCTSSQQVNQFLKLLLLALGQSYDRQPLQKFELLFDLLFQVMQTVPMSAVNCQTIQILAELRFMFQDRSISESFFKNLIMSADFWISTDNLEVIQEFWSFVKVIYSQNPVQHNKIFPIDRLVNLMIKISETPQKFCCDYHKKTHEIFNRTDSSSEQQSETQEGLIQIDRYLEPISGVLECVLTSGGNEILPEIDHLTHSLTLKSCSCYQMQVLRLIKVLLLDSKSDQDCASPVEFAQRFVNARGLEILLHLCANNASLDVKAMCIKLIDVLSSHANLIQMRIDTDLITYLSHVLLPPSLKQNSVANQLAKAAQKRDQQQDITQSATLNYKVMSATDAESFTPQKQLGLKFFSYQEAVAEETDYKEIQAEDGVNSEAGIEQDDQFQSEQLVSKAFSKTAENLKTNFAIAPAPFANKGPQKKIGFDLLGEEEVNDSEHEEQKSLKEESEEEFKNVGPGIPFAPKGTSKHQGGGFKFGGLMLDGDSSSELDSSEQRGEVELIIEEPVQKPKPKTQMLSFQKSKPRGLANLDLNDDDEVFQAPPSRQEHQRKFGDRILGNFDSDEEYKHRTNDEEPPKPTQDVLMSRNLRGGANKGFNFALGEGDSSNNSEDEQSKVVPPVLSSANRAKTKPPPFLGGQVDLELPPAKNRQKQGRGLRLSLDEGEQTENQLSEIINKVQSGGNTGATKDVDYEDNQPILSLPQRRGPGKPLRSLALDTEKINELFNFGGEKGEMREEDALEKLEQDIKELASICVEAMHKKQGKTQMSEFETLLETSDLNLESKDDEFLLFNKPQTVKGIKKIDIEDRKKRPVTLTGISEEEEQQLIKSDRKATQSSQAIDDAINQVELASVAASSNEQVDSFTEELENVYTSCLEWILNRVPQGLFKTLMIDDYDKITFLPAMQVLMKLVTHSNNMMRQRALQDMFMLAQWDSQNGQVILQHYVFHSWLLELLMPYQSERSTDSAKAVYDMGTKLHTLLLKNACTNPDEEDGFKKVNLLVRWPAVASEKNYDQHIAHDLARYLLKNLIEALGQQSLVTSQGTLKNLSQITLQVHELVISSNEILHKNLAEYRPGNNESILQWMQRSFISYGVSLTNQENQWREWDVCTGLVQSWGLFLFGAKNKLLDQEGVLQEKAIKQLLKVKSQEEIRILVSLLMQDNQSSHSPSAQQVNKPNSSRLNILGGFKGSADKGLKTNVTTTFNIHCLQAIVNLICLALTQSSTHPDKSVQKKWLSILELYFKYIITLSEVWQTKLPDEQFYKRSQRRFAEVCSFILAFLFQEIHSQPKSQPVTPSNESRSGTVSPHGDIQKTKQYQQCLKSCIIYLISLASSDKQQSSDRACHIILTEILVKQYSTSSKPLINPTDLSIYSENGDADSAELVKNQKKQEIRESFFEEFPQCFQQNDWKITFFHNSHINQIINSQINIEMIQNFQQKRQQYAVRLVEQEASTTQANEEILKKIQIDVMQAVTETTQQLHELNSFVQFDVDLIMRQSSSTMKEWIKSTSIRPGVWHKEPEITFKTLRSQLLGEGQHCLMKDRASNSFSYIEDKQVQSVIFRKVYPSMPLIQQKSLPFQFFTKRISKNVIEEIGQSAKQRIVDKILDSLKPERKIVIECEQVSLLKALERRTGTLVMTNFEVIFVYDLSSEGSKSDSNIFFFNWQQNPTKSLVKKIALSDVKELQKRRFLGQNKALELFLMSNHTVIFDFKNVEQRDKFAKKILRQRQNKCKNLNYYSSLDPKWILKKSGLTEEWLNNKISNFQYLMSLNQLAGRSYHDLSQYPVFPWTLTLAKNTQIPDLLATCVRGGAPPAHFRDLTKNMQLLGSAERQAEFKRKYEDSEGFIGLDDRFHCGSHYSNPGIVLHYFARLQPLLEAHIVLQGMAMDHPDRIFQSVQYSYQHSLTDFSDVRELTPEFYCLPEIMKNSNLCNFGHKQDGTKVDDVILPEWAQGDAVKFVQIMRESFESTYVSSNISSWIDYVFGYKQRDTEAVNSLNTFSKITYQVDQPGDFDITTIQDKAMRLAYENQGYNFGQTPIQLFKEKHPQKTVHTHSLKVNLVVDEHAKLKIFKPVPVKETIPKTTNQPLISPEAIMFAKFVDEQRIVGVKKENFIQNFVWIPKAHDQNPTISFSLGSDKKSKFDGFESVNGMDQVDRSSKRFDFPMTITGQGTHVVKGGYWDGRVVFSPVEGTQATFYELNDHKTTVTAVACDKQETTLITGTKSGEVIVWRNQNSECSIELSNLANPWIKLKNLNDHSRQITSIFISEEMCLFATSSTDGQINIYNLWNAKLIRNYVQPNLQAIHTVVLAQSPLPLVAYFTRDDHTWNAITINGEQVFKEGSEQKTKYEEASHIVQPLVIKSSNHIEKLIYGTERGSICMRSLPSLERYKKLQVSKDFPVLTLIVSPDRRFLLTGCGDGGLIVITERSDLQAQQNQITGLLQPKTTKSSTTPSTNTPTSQQSVLSSIQSLVSKQ